MPLIMSKLKTSAAYRMTRRVVGGVLLAMLCVRPASAQSTPAAFWTQPSVASTTQAAGFTYRLYTTPAGSTTPNAAVVLTSVTCTGTVPNVNCTAPLGPAVAATALATGAKSTLSVQDTVNGSAEIMSGPFTAGPFAPTAFSIR